MLTVGTLTVLDPELFPDQTVWSSYGAGYGWLPLVLPFVGLAWLWHTRALTPVVPSDVRASSGAGASSSGA